MDIQGVSWLLLRDTRSFPQSTSFGFSNVDGYVVVRVSLEQIIRFDNPTKISNLVLMDIIG